MSEQNKPFVVTDRRKFNMDGSERPDADPSPERESPAAAAPASQPPLEFKSPNAAAKPEPPAEPPQAATPEAPPPPTASEMEQANTAYQATADRLDTAVRAANPGMEHPPAMSFEQIIQSVYMTTMLQLGGGTQEGQQPRVDLMGARQSVDMLGILAEKTKGNLTPAESQLLDNALFEARMAFLEVTQALARSAAARPGPPVPGAPGSMPPGPKIVR